MIIDLWLSVVNAHPLAHFNSMVGDPALVTHPDSNPDWSHNFSVWLMSVLFNFSMVYIQSKCYAYFMVTFPHFVLICQRA